MVLIRLASDIHLETRGSNDLTDIIPEMVSDRNTYLVLAGDVTNIKDIDVVFQQLHERFKHVIFVAGNHEFWRNSLDSIKDARDSNKYHNVHILDNSRVDFEDLSFYGGTMWTELTNPITISCALEKKIKDFAFIEGLTVDRCNQMFSQFVSGVENFLNDQSVKKHVIVSHFLPSRKSISRRFNTPGNEPYNDYFASPIIERFVFAEKQYDVLWLHGHTHDCVDYQVGGFHVHANPLGYPHDISSFDKYKTIVIL